MSEKPVIFISHSSDDNNLARDFQVQISNCFEGKVEGFAADILPGENWFQKVMAELNRAKAIIVLITPNSVRGSHWVWFELGYFWARHDDALTNQTERSKIYYPVLFPETNIPNPVKDLQIQWTDTTSANELKKLFERLCNQLKLGNADKIDYVNLSEKLSHSTRNHEVVALPNSDRSDITSPYSHYSDNELCQLLDDYLNECSREYGNAIFQADNIGEPWLVEDRKYLFNGMLIDYQSLDRDLRLPKGTSKKFLKTVAANYDLYPPQNADNENTIRFNQIIKARLENSRSEDDASFPDVPF